MKPDAILYGIQKTATTWIWRCLQEHPGVSVASTDATDYYNLNMFLKNKKWFSQQFGKGVKVDISQNYFTGPQAMYRLKEEAPDVKVFICLRNPVQRTFSHYWHTKKKGKVQNAFTDVFTSNDLLRMWVEPSLYYDRISELMRLFKNVKIVWFDDLEKDPVAFMQDIYSFIGVDAGFVPTIAHQKVNAAGHRRNLAVRGVLKAGSMLDKAGLRQLRVLLNKHGVTSAINSVVSSKAEYEKGIDRTTYKKLLQFFRPDINNLEKLLQVDLSHWKRVTR